VVDVAHIIIAITVETVVMVVAAVVIAEFFIRPAMKIPVATEANFGGCDHIILLSGGAKQESKNKILQEGGIAY
jgi:hypothetical protein